MILDLVKNKLLAYNNAFKDSKHDISCDIVIEDSKEILKTYGRCHREIFYEVNNYPVDNPSINNKLSALFLSSKKDIFIKVVADEIDSFFDCIVDGIGVNVYSCHNSSVQKSHVIETFFCLVKHCDKINVGNILLIDRDNVLSVIEIKVFNSETDSHPCVDGNIDFSISLKNINYRRKLLFNYIKNNELPPIDYLQTYSSNVAKLLYKYGVLSHSQYNRFLKEPFGDFNCVKCNFKNRCKEDVNGAI